MTKETNKVATVPETTPHNSFLAVIERAASDPSVNIEKMGEMLALQERIMKRQAEIDYTEAMSNLQPMLPEIKKTAKGHNTKYAKYEDVDRAIRPLYTAAGFATGWDTKAAPNGETEYIGTCSHRGGHSKCFSITLPDDKSGNKSPVQAKASTLSYAKRYLLQMMFNVVCVDEDDDGAAFKPLDNTIAVDLDKQLRTLPDYKDYMPKFLKYMKAPDVQSIKATDYQKAVIAINTEKAGVKNVGA